MEISKGTGMDQPSSETGTYRCVISAGPTREYFDPFRYISNPSTGKMGYAIAEAALSCGWSVDLVSGPTGLAEPNGCIFYPVESGEEMYHQIDALYDACDLLIMSAAVADYRPAHYSPNKLKKNEMLKEVLLEPVRDILRTVNERKKEQYVVGFAAETENIEEYARKKLAEKRLDMIVANQIGVVGSGFGADTNKLLVILPRGETYTLGPADKKLLGKELVAIIEKEMAMSDREKPGLQ